MLTGAKPAPSTDPGARRRAADPPRLQDLHRAKTFTTGLAGIHAVSLVSARSFPRHSHDQIGFGLIVAGGHASWSGIGPVDARAGDLITVNPGEIHDGHPMRGEPRHWRMIYLDPAVLADWQDRPGADVHIARPVIAAPAFAASVLAAQLARLFARLHADPTPDRFAVEEAVLGCVAALLRDHGSRDPFARGRTGPIERARRRIEAVPEAALSLADLADEAGLSRFQLIRGFAREVGATPHAYLTQARVLRARRLIAAGRPLAEAALDAGFADQSHMTRAFVRQFGIAPGRYRAALA